MLLATTFLEVSAAVVEDNEVVVFHADLDEHDFIPKMRMREIYS